MTANPTNNPASPMSPMQPTGLHRAAPVHTPGQIAASNTAHAAPTPLGKRPKGRLFVALIMFAAVGLVLHYIYQSYYANIAYGSVSARVVRVSPAWDGIVRSIHVVEGQKVKTHELLATVDNLQIEQQIARASDQLKIAQADLNAELVRLRMNDELQQDRRRKSAAEYYQAWGDLLVSRSEFADLQQQVEASKFLNEHHAVAATDHQTLLLKYEGHREKMRKLEIATQELKERSQIVATDDVREALLEPRFVAVQTLQDEIKRLRDSLGQSEIRSPVQGTVVHLHRFSGERCGPGEFLIEIAEEGSTRITLFIEQQNLADIRSRETVQVVVHSGEMVECRIDRFGLQFQPPPSNLTRLYPSHRKVLPVHLQPLPGEQVDLLIDSEVRLPRNWNPLEWSCFREASNDQHASRELP
jgi:multidrug resistance efflux pump